MSIKVLKKVKSPFKASWRGKRKDQTGTLRAKHSDLSGFHAKKGETGSFIAQKKARPDGYFKDAWSPEDIAWANQTAHAVARMNAKHAPA